MGNPVLRVERPLRRILLLALVVPIAVVAASFAAALIRAPGVSDLPARVAALERAHSVHPVQLDRISSILREAVVATEDERFYRQRGVDVIALARAVPFDVTHLSLAQGASTIAEQLAKITYLGGNDHSPWRKLTDMALGFRIGHRYSHDQVLADYLNVAYFGDGAYGIGNAAQRYFRRGTAQLDLAQGSILAGLIQAPSLYDPYRNAQGSRDRQIDVLRSMVRNGYVTERQAAAVAAEPLRFAGGRNLAPVHGVGFDVAAPFDWGELAIASLMLAGALAAGIAARLVAPGLAARGGLRLAMVLLLLAGVLTAARSVQVI
jgi:membrane peptidoglycan carboxypeptidase